MTLKQLASLYAEKEYSKVPEHARPVKKFSDGSANDLTTAVLAYFHLKGWLAWRTPSEGRYLPEKRIKNVLGQSIVVGKGIFIPRGKASLGIGDISIIRPPNGQMISLEVKYGKDRQSDDQKKWQASLESMGGIYLIAKTWDDFYQQIKGL